MSIKKELLEKKTQYYCRWRFLDSMKNKGEREVLVVLIDLEDNATIKKDSEGYFECAVKGFLEGFTGLDRGSISKHLESLSLAGFISYTKVDGGKCKIKLNRDYILGYKERVEKSAQAEKDGDEKSTPTEKGDENSARTEKDGAENSTPINTGVMKNQHEGDEKSAQTCGIIDTHKNSNNNKEQESVFTISHSLPNNSPSTNNPSTTVEECINEDLPSDNLHGTGLETGDGKNGTPNPEGAILKDTPQGDETMNTVTENLEYSRANVEKVTKTFTEEYNKTGVIPDFGFFDKAFPNSEFRLYTEAKENVKRYSEFVNPPKNKHTEEELREWERFKPLLDSWTITQEKMNRETMDNLEHPVEGSHYEVINKWVRYYKPQATYLQVMHFLSIFNTAFSRKWLSKDFDPANEPRNIITGYWTDEEAKDYFCLQGMPIDALKGLIKTYGSRLPHFKELASAKDSDLTYHLNCYKSHRG